MAVTAKICGLNESATIEAAVAGGASHIGLNFYSPSPRAVTVDEAGRLIQPIPASVCTVGVFVDADDALIDSAVAAAALDMLQLHGSETPGHVAALKLRTGCSVMKAISVAQAADLVGVEQYCEVADWLMFDAKPPTDIENPLPGGNARSFDWKLLSGRQWPIPWMLAGGLNSANVGKAVALTGAAVVDCSSGVEDRPGSKSLSKIAKFLAVVAEL
jgi:phosphoribosylanthranilate isomerase